MDRRPREYRPRQEQDPVEEFGRAFASLEGSMMKAIGKSGAGFDANSVMPREVFDTMNDDANLTDSGWKKLKAYYDLAPAQAEAMQKRWQLQEASETAPAPKTEAAASAPAPTETPRATVAAEEPAPKIAPEKKNARRERRLAAAAAKAQDEATSEEASPTAAPQETPVETAHGRPEQKEEKDERVAHELIIKKDERGQFKVHKRGDRDHLDSTIITKIRLPKAAIERLDKEPEFARELARETDELRNEWRTKRDLEVDIPDLAKLEGKNDEQETKRLIVELLQAPKTTMVTASYLRDEADITGPDDAYVTEKIAASEIFPGKSYSNLIEAIPSLPRADIETDEEARKLWKGWGSGKLFNNVIDFLVSRDLRKRYEQKKESKAKAPKPPTEEAAPVATPEPTPARPEPIPTTPEPTTTLTEPVPEATEPAPEPPLGPVHGPTVRIPWQPPETDAKRILPPYASDVTREVEARTPEERAALWAQAHPDDTGHPRLAKSRLPSKKEGEEAERTRIIAEEQVTEQQPPAPTASAEKKVASPEKEQTPESPEKKKIRRMVEATLNAVTRREPDVAAALSSPKVRDQVMAWYQDLLALKNLTLEDQEEFGLIRDPATDKITVRLKTFKNVIEKIRSVATGNAGS